MKERASKLDAYADLLNLWFGSDHLPLEEARRRLKERGMDVSIARLSTWWANEQQKILEAQVLGGLVSGSQMCSEIDRAIGKAPEPSMERIMKLLKMLVMNLAGKGQLDPALLKLVDRLLKPVLAWQDGQRHERVVDLDERRLKLMEARAAKAEAAEQAAQDPALSPEEKASRWKEIFAIG